MGTDRQLTVVERSVCILCLGVFDMHFAYVRNCIASRNWLVTHTITRDNFSVVRSPLVSKYYGFLKDIQKIVK